MAEAKDKGEGPPLPSRWCLKDRSPLLEVSLGCRVKYVGSGDSDKDAASVRTTVPVPASCGLFYYEVKVLNKGRHGYIGIGFTSTQTAHNRLPGWDKTSYGYHGDDGHSFSSSGTGKPYGPTFTQGDVVGCLLSLYDHTISYTKNGLYLGVAFHGVGLSPEDNSPLPLYPCVGLRTPGEEIEANFGRTAFVFDIATVIAETRAKARAQVEEVPLPTAVPSRMLDQLVAAYLAQNGYQEAAQELCRATGLVLREPTATIAARRAIRDDLLAGNIDAACARLETHFPALLAGSPRLQFEVQRRRFVETAAATQADDDTQLDALLAAGRELQQRADALGDDPAIRERLEEVFSLLAYPDPQSGPMAYLLAPEQREELAQTVNAELLAAQDLPRESALDKVLNRTQRSLDQLREQGNGTASFLSVEDYTL